MGILQKLFAFFNSDTKAINEQGINPATPDRIATFDDAEKYFKAFGLFQYFESIKPSVRPKIDIELTPIEEKDIAIGSSKVGGRPDLSPGINWPKTNEEIPLSFIAQLNCEEMSKFDDSGLLPKSGQLSFFYSADQDAWGFDPKDRDKFCVLYNNSVSGFRRENFPAELPEEGIYIANSVAFSNALSFPDGGNEAVAELLADKDSDSYYDLAAGGENQVFGYAGQIQGEMEPECQLVTNGLYCGDSTGYTDPRAGKLKEGAKDWLLLLQIGSEDEKTAMMWGDSGRLYFWIRKQDLAAERFDKSWCILQCC
ncbi:YwqG family protein [Mucilaginibacter sp.]|uniref:YwqG family protein n=1 Tax=Mucilaginibacter sp. TaxID=1882438 RepID=UPI0025F0A667|nr:YwqG family protein [Mucilaginibacter sp.]